MRKPIYGSGNSSSNNRPPQQFSRHFADRAAFSMPAESILPQLRAERAKRRAADDARARALMARDQERWESEGGFLSGRPQP